VRKEQILLLVAVALGGLLVFTATGKYTEVGADTLPAGKPVQPLAVPPADPVRDRNLTAAKLTGRALFAQVRLEKRAPMPDLPAPAALPPFWVPPQTTPGVQSSHWSPFRGPIPQVKGPAKSDKPEDDQTGIVPTNPDTAAPEAAAPPPDIGQIQHPGQKPFNKDKQAKLVRLSGEEITCRLEPSGPFKGKPDWVILEKWPNVQFKVAQLNEKNGTEVGTNELVGPADLQGYKTVHLMKTLDNEFMEERIGRQVKDTDRDALVTFAKWVFETLPKKSGVDDVTYGLAAVKKATAELEKAKAAGNPDLSLVKLLGEYYRAGYDLEGELKTYLDYVAAGRANDAGAQILLGDAYERLGTYSAAAALYEKAAQTGDPEARLRMGLVAEREGRLADAMEMLKGVAGSSGVAGRAYTAMARIALARGDVPEAASYAEQAKKDGTSAASLVAGAVLYAQRKFPDAEKAFAAAKQEEDSAWRSDRGLSLVAKGDLEEGQKELQTCLDTDPLNLLDPLFGLGDSYQRRADLVQRSNDFFEIALARSPDNPWILLRVGTIRLRDNQPQKALDLGLHLLEVAPGCNEGLWLVGRAAASLEKPDWDKAVSYLRRAVEKENKNRDFIHEYARVLLLAGRIEEAIKVLDVATNVTSGVGRSDARLLALLAWARFLGKRPITDVFEAIQRGRNNQPDDATKEWLTSVRKIMDDWDRTRIWVDEFDRQPSSTVGNGWNEQEQASGINIAVDGNHAVFSCPAVKQPGPSRDGATRMYRDEDLGRFKSMEASFKAEMGVETIFHLSLGALPDRGGTDSKPSTGRRGQGGGAEVGIGCDRTGTMVLWVTGNDMKGGGTKEWVVKTADGSPRQWPLDEYHTVKIVRKDDAKGVFEILLDDERIAGADGKTTFEVGALILQPGKNAHLGFLVDADTGQKVDVSVEYVQVTKTTR
jgi:tetratricopeptide (TPR) repeat protein